MRFTKAKKSICCMAHSVLGIDNVSPNSTILTQRDDRKRVRDDLFGEIRASLERVEFVFWHVVAPDVCISFGHFVGSVQRPCAMRKRMEGCGARKVSGRSSQYGARGRHTLTLGT